MHQGALAHPGAPLNQRDDAAPLGDARPRVSKQGLLACPSHEAPRRRILWRCAVLDAELMVAALSERLARYKLPRSVDFERELPRHPSGKLYVRRLKERYWAGRDKRI